MELLVCVMHVLVAHASQLPHELLQPHKGTPAANLSLLDLLSGAQHEHANGAPREEQRLPTQP